MAPLTMSELLDRCYEFHGTEPTVNEADIFAKANGLPVKRRSGRPWREWVAEWKDNRRERGLPLPDGPPPFGQRPDYSKDVGAAKAHERRGRRRWDDRDEVVEWVARYLRTLTGRSRGTQRGYLAWASQNPGAPYNETLAKYGGWTVVRDAAWAVIRQPR